MTEHISPTPEDETAKIENEFSYDRTGNVSKAFYALRSHLLDNNLIDESDLETLAVTGHNYFGGIGLGRQEVNFNPGEESVTEAGIMLKFPSINVRDYEDIEDDTLIITEIFASYTDPRDYNNNSSTVLAGESYLARDITDEVIEKYKEMVKEHFINALKHSGLNKKIGPIS